ncbi:MAG: hypothetical protein II336_08970 [Loktanella sp.]|nr:hypothetical protein [Loktanella sp.]
MDYSDKWLGTIGGGFSASVVGGMSAYQTNLWSMNGGAVPIPAFVFGTRVGVVAQAEMGHCFCLLTGVSGPHAFSEIRSRGVDWVLSFGGKIDAVTRSYSSASQLLLQASAKTGNWAAQESAKRVVQTVMGDFDIRPGSPSFVLLPSPLAVGVGAGVFYEWQTLTKVGTDVAWRYLKPEWRVENAGDKVVLHVNAIPEADGTQIGLQFRVKRFGSDDLLIFESSRSGLVNMRRTNQLKTVRASVQNGSLVDPATGQKGLDLTALVPVGRSRIGMFSVSSTPEQLLNERLQIGVNITRDPSSDTNLYKWESKHYVPLQTDGRGRFVSAADLGMKT